MKKIYFTLCILLLVINGLLARGICDVVKVVDDFGDVTGTGAIFLSDNLDIASEYYLLLTLSPDGIYLNLIDSYSNELYINNSDINFRITDTDKVLKKIGKNNSSNNFGQGYIADPDLAWRIGESLRAGNTVKIILRIPYLGNLEYSFNQNICTMSFQREYGFSNDQCSTIYHLTLDTFLNQDMSIFTPK